MFIAHSRYSVISRITFTVVWYKMRKLDLRSIKQRNMYTIVVWDSDLVSSDCFNKSDENLPRPKSITAKIRHDPGSISDWSPAPAYVAENDPIQNAVSLGSPLRERKTVSKKVESTPVMCFLSAPIDIFDQCDILNIILTFTADAQIISLLNDAHEADRHTVCCILI